MAHVETEAVIVAHVPVLHQGYRQFFEAYPENEIIYVLGESLTKPYRELKKDIRRLKPELACAALSAWYPKRSVKVADERTLKEIAGNKQRVVLPDETVSRNLAEKYFLESPVEYYPVFLRWDRKSAELNDPVAADRAAGISEFDPRFRSQPKEAALRSSNIWRRVGAALVQNGEVIAAASNIHRLGEHTPWIDGDVRALFGRGYGIGMSTDQHAESCVIAEAARRGIALEGAELYATTFPCPPCAMLIAYSGVKTLYYAKGYGVLDGERVLKENGVELVRVEIELSDSPSETYVPYPEK